MITEIKKKTISGIKWTFLSNTGSRIANLIVIAILARLLSPSEFGLFGIAMAILALLSTFNELGFSAAIIQKQDITEEDLSSSFIINIALGAVLFLIFVAISPLAGIFYKQPRLPLIIIISSVVLVINPLMSTHVALVYKNLRWRIQAIIEIAQVVSSAVLSIVMAWAGYGVYSLVFGTIVGPLTGAILYWCLTEWRPRFLFSMKSVKRLFNYGINIIGINLINVFQEKGDQLIIGKFLGVQSLGMYTLSSTLVNYPKGKFLSIIVRVLFPSFSIIQGDRKKLTKAYCDIQTSIGLISFPLLTFLAILANEIVQIVYGSNWAPIAPVIRVLCIGGIFHATTWVFDPLFKSIGKPDVQLKATLFSVICLFAGIFVGARYGLIGVAWSVTFFNVVYCLLVIYSVQKYFGIGIPYQLSSFKSALIANGMMLLTLSVYRYFFIGIGYESVWLSLIIQAFLGLSSYLGAVYFLEKDFLLNMIHFLHPKRIQTVSD